MDLATYYSPSGAARFLQSKGEKEPFRYFGYDPWLEEGLHVSSHALFADPAIQALEANGRATLLGLQDVQGYNPTHLARYDEYINALNAGSGQGYHFVGAYEKGLYSPLLNLLNVRYIVVPSHPPKENQVSLERFELEHAPVYEDDRSKVLENPEALPRAWIVHSARKEESSEEALRLLGSKEVDPKQEALLEDEPPQQISQPRDPSADQVSVEKYEANQIRLKTYTGAGGLLVLSEVYYPQWKAYVDGQPAPVYTADQLLRSVPVPAGNHEVELRYESWSLSAGIAVSLVAYTALVLLSITVGVQRWRKSRGGTVEK